MNTIVTLSQYQFIRVSGADTRSFLQGQVSCDVNKISTSNSVRGALCNLKGRVIADFRALQINEDILLQVSADLVDTVLAVLKKYAVFSKITLNHDESFCSLGLIVPREETENFQIPDSVSTIRTDTRKQTVTLIELWGTVSDIATTREALAMGTSEGTQQQWIDQENLRGIAHVTKKTSEEYTPALLNYDISGVVDFKKGCYTGQEIVARMFYRSTPKKRLFGLVSEQALPQGFAVTEVGGDTISELLSTGTHSTLAILPFDANKRSYQVEDQASEQGTLLLIEFDYSQN